VNQNITTLNTENEKARQYMYKVPMGCVGATIVAVENQ
jgi:hypothetical protein